MENPIFSHNQATLRVLMSLKLTEWLVEECLDALSVLAHWSEVNLIWVPWYCGIPGNEKPDELLRQTWCFSDRALIIDYILIINLMHWLLFFIKYYFPLHVSSLKCSSSGGYNCTHAAYGTVTLYESSWWPVGTQLEWELTVGGRLLVGVSREWQYHTLHVYNCILLKISTWVSKHVEENNILRINSNQCIKLVINI